VLEYLNFAQRKLPQGVTPSLGPDATGVGWVFEYAVIGARHSLAELRAIQDWLIRFQLTKADGVAEVASVGGFVKQYQVVVDPAKLRAYGISLAKIGDAIRASNRDVGGRTIEMSEREYMVRGRGYLRGPSDLEQIALKSENGTPVFLRDLARVEIGPDERRGLTELNGEGEVAAGIVLQREGENALDVIKSVKQKITDLAPALPAGVKILPVYDRSSLIYRAIDTLKRTLLEESLIVALVCFLFLMHARSALVAIITLPLGVLQMGGVRFVPDLDQKEAAARELVMGHVIKVILHFSSAFWEKRGITNLSFLHARGEMFPTWWTTRPVATPILIGWAGGPPAEQLSYNDEETIRAAAITSLANALKTSPRVLERRLTAAVVCDWQSDPFSAGAYSYVPVGAVTAALQLAEPVANTLFCAGEATNADGAAGTVHGAIATGLRAAGELLSSRGLRAA